MQWYKQVPRKPDENLRFRLFLYEKAKKNRPLQESLLAMCRQDILFFISAFVWQFNPNSIGSGSPEMGPFIPWEGQEPLFLTIEKCIEAREDLAIEKSREMGASWGCILAFAHQFLFRRHKKFIMVSRNEAMVDSPDDPDSLFWKLDFIFEHLPDWMTWGIKRRKLGYINQATGSTITGQATTGKAGVGGRATAMFLDEFALIPDATEIWQRTSGTSNCRIVNSTHDGPGTMFYKILHDPVMAKYVNRLQMHWSQHPDKRKGLYKYDAAKRKIIVLDKSYKFPPNYPFVKDGTPTGGPHLGLRSVWYDQKCGVMGDPRAIAIDLDIDPKGSISQVFDAIRITELIRNDAREPLWEGIIIADDFGKLERIEPRANGAVRIWTPLNDNKPQPSRYFIGCDIAQGVGSTPSCATIIDALTREVVLELVTRDVRPEGFAKLVSALGWLFKDSGGMGAKIAWETSGPGGMFKRTLMAEYNYENVYCRKSEAELDRGKRLESPGWVPTVVNKVNLLSSYRASLENGDLINRSAESLNECLEFRFNKKTGAPEHSGESTDDPAGTRINHGDRVISAALAWMMAREVVGQVREEKKKVLVGSLSWRRLLAYNEQKKRQEEWI